MKGNIEIPLRHAIPFGASMFFFILYGVMMVVTAFHQGDYFTGIMLSIATLWWSHVLMSLVSVVREKIRKK